MFSDNNLEKLTGMEENRFECHICLKTFPVKSKLIRHKRIHTREKTFNCDICSKIFINKVCLVKHERIHIGIDIYHRNKFAFDILELIPVKTI